jgi:hypothetical protein
MAFEWDIVFKVGSLSGMVSLIIWVATRLYGWFKRPSLKMEFERSRDLQIYQTFYAPNKAFIRKFFNLHVRNLGKYTAKRCVAIAEVLSSPPNAVHLRGGHAIHWADVPYSGRTTGAEPVDIGSEIRRLDVVFTDKDNSGGAWLSIPFALSMPNAANQAYLPAGDYELKVSVSCENGRGETKKFKITSPQNWTDLEAVETS